MNDAQSLFDIVLVVSAVVLPVIATIRLLAGWEPFDGLGPGSLTWPTGVQEDDFEPWRFADATT
jgi:hypothetical protein